MRVLWLKMGGLWPVNTGGRRRSCEILSALSQRHQVVVVTTDGPSDEPAGLAAHLADAEQLVSVPYAVPKVGTVAFAGALARSWASRYPVDLWKWRVAAAEQAIADCVRTHAPDVIVADFLFAVANVRVRDVPVVYFSHNVEYRIWERLCGVETKPWRKALMALEWRKLRRCEFRACREADLTIAVSDNDRDEMLTGAPSARIRSIPTGVDVDYFRSQARTQIAGRLAFSGSMDWYPNEDAMTYFAEAILPRVRRAVPAVSLSVVGRNPTPTVRALEGDAIHVTGTVDDVRPSLDESELYIVPLRVGGGTRIKIFEALAMGKAVVSTTIGAEGLDLVPGTHIEIADDPDAFADRIIALLADPARRRALGENGRELVERRYSWTAVTEVFESHLQEAVHEHAATEAERSARVS